MQLPSVLGDGRLWKLQLTNNHRPMQTQENSSIRGMTRRRALLSTVSLLGGLCAMPSWAQDQEAEVKAALRLVRDWQLGHTTYHLKIDTLGQFVRTQGNLYCYPGNGPGGRVWKLDNHIFEPQEARCVFEQTSADIIAYFPETTDHVLTKMLPNDADLLAPGLLGLPVEDQVMAPTKVCTISDVGDLKELRMVFDPRKLKVSPSKADITILLRFDSAGQIRRLEQKRLGLSQVTTMTYLSFDLNTILQRVPATPNPTQVSNSKTYDQAFQDSILFFRRQKQV